MQLDPATIAVPGRLADAGVPELRDRLRALGRRLLRGRTNASAWVLPTLILLLAGTASLYLWNLADSGWANAYYSAAVQAGAKDWQAMLFGSFDPANAITVDKTPAALWVMSLSARIFGFNAWSVLAPQALMGVASVWLLYLTVRRTFGPLAGLVAGAALALTPVAALMFRFNNPDALLTVLLVAAAYATVRAIGRASTRWLLLAGALVGFAFLAKMLQAFLVIPALAGVYLVAAPANLPRRLLQVGGAAVAVVVSGGWYLALVALWPAASRPYIGGSQTNSLLDLILGYNGFGRITGQEVGRVGGGPGFNADAGALRLSSATRQRGGVAAAGRPARSHRPALAPAPHATDGPAARPGAAVGRLARADRPCIQPHGGDLPRLLHGRPRAGHRRAGGDRSGRRMAASTPPSRPARPRRRASS